MEHIQLPLSKYQIFPSQRLPSSQNDSVDDVIHQKERTLKSKLEVLAFQVIERFKIRTTSLDRIGEQEEGLNETIRKLTIAANYGWREHKEKSLFYEALIQLGKERREQDTECWRDVVLVMRDFLMAWESHEQEKMRRFLLHA